MARLHNLVKCDQEKRHADVVLIHGLGGDPFATWRHGRGSSTLWPYWFSTSGSNVGAWSLEHAGRRPTKWERCFLPQSQRPDQPVALADQARFVLDAMVQKGVGQRPLMLICHSLGGLLAKHILRTAYESTDAKVKAISEQTRAVLFLATPHGGDSLVSLQEAFQTIFQTPIRVEELEIYDACRQDLKLWYRNYAALNGIETLTFFEGQDVFGQRINDFDSSDPGIGHKPIELKKDHIAIAQPLTIYSQLCRVANDLLKENVLVQRPEPQVSTTINSLKPQTPPQPFFGRRKEVEALVQRLQNRQNTVLSGLPGIGKLANWRLPTKR